LKAQEQATDSEVNDEILFKEGGKPEAIIEQEKEEGDV